MFARSSIRCARSSTRKAPFEGTSAHVRPLRAGSRLPTGRAQSSASGTARSATASFSTNPTRQTAPQEEDGGRKTSDKVPVPGPRNEPTNVRGDRGERFPREHPCAIVADLEEALLGTSFFAAQQLSNHDLEVLGKVNRLERLSSSEARSRSHAPGTMGYRWRLRRLNAIASDMITRRQKLPPELCLQAMVKAIECRSTPAMLFYLKHLKKRPAADFRLMLRSICSWIGADDFEGADSPRHRMELLTLLTGYPTGCSDGVHERVTPNLLGLMDSPGDWRVGRDLLIAIRELGGASALTAAWSETLNTWCLGEDSYAASKPLGSESRPNLGLLEVMVTELCQSSPPDFESAWKLAEPHLDNQEAFSYKTWEHLLLSPELIDRHGGLRPHMEGVLKQIMEQWADNIERELSIKWNPSTGQHTATKRELGEAFRETESITSGDTPSLPEDFRFDTETGEAVDMFQRRRQDLLVIRRKRRLEYEKMLREEDVFPD